MRACFHCLRQSLSRLTEHIQLYICFLYIWIYVSPPKSNASVTATWVEVRAINHHHQNLVFRERNRDFHLKLVVGGGVCCNTLSNAIKSSRESYLITILVFSKQKEIGSPP